MPYYFSSPIINQAPLQTLPKQVLLYEIAKGKLVYENSANASRFGAYYDGNVPVAMQKAFKPIEKFDYFYSENLTPTIDYPKVESTPETEQSFEKIFRQ